MFCLVRPTRKHKEPASGHWTWTPGLIFEGRRILKNRPTDPGRDLFCFVSLWPEADYGKTSIPISAMNSICPDRRNHRFLMVWRVRGHRKPLRKAGHDAPRLLWFLGPPGPNSKIDGKSGAGLLLRCLPHGPRPIAANTLRRFQRQRFIGNAVF